MVGDYEVGEDELAHPIGQSDLHFVPVIAGAGGRTGRFITGAALIGVGILSGGTGFALNATQGVGFFGGSLAATAGNVGVLLTLSGVADLLTPIPKTPDFTSEQDPRISFKFSGLQNTSRAGTPVPIVYGEIFTGSVVISAGVDTEQVRA